MDESTPLSDVEIREIKSRTIRNHTASFAFVSAGLLLFTIMVQLLSGNYDNKTTYPVGATGANNTYYLYITPSDKSLLNGTPFYNSNPGGVNQQSPKGYIDQQVEVSAQDGCDTKYGAYQLVISGLTPNGYYSVQTGSDYYGHFGYGFGGHANGYGQATYTWSCYDEFGMLPEGSYGVLVTDRKTGFALVTYLTVALASHGK